MISKRILYEKTLTAADRRNLDPDQYGIPALRKFPLIDKRHIISANSYFDTAPDKYKKSLAKRILAAAKEKGIDTSKWEAVNKAASE
jgi:hypothetical protein